MDQILKNIADQQDFNLLQVHPLQGGDINEVFLLKCDRQDYVIKLNSAIKFPEMFEAEAEGLELLRSSESFRIPKVFAFGEIDKFSYLILEYIGPGKTSIQFWRYFGEQLAKLHKTTQTNFGLNRDNYIGSLPQINDVARTAAAFYVNSRLEPQFKLAYDQGFTFSNLNSFYKNISEDIPNEPPSLIHGDLWNGNYLVSKDGLPVLIDPAVSFSHREMDIAMMHLFGGFSTEVFSEYNNSYPLLQDWKDRISLWQLYYLLVHLNLFGSGYLGQVRAIVNRYS